METSSMEDSVDIKILECSLTLIVDSKATQFSKLELMRAFETTFPMFVFNTEDGLFDDLITEDEYYLCMNVRLKGNENLHVVRKRAHKTNRFCLSLALEILASDPDRWWSTRELAEEAIKRDFFDIDLMPIRKIQTCINTVLMNTNSKYTYHKTDKIFEGAKRECNFFKFKRDDNEYVGEYCI